MWARIYPHVILLIFVNIFKVSCVGTSSLSFVIDDTGSMQNDINQVKRSANEIMDIVYNEKASLIHNMVLVTVNDPVSTVRVVTQNRDTFKRSLDAVYAHNIVNYDCWEPSMQGILLALERSLPGSYIYVFTDASAKDYEKGALVMEMCQRKQSQIVFVLTGRCYSYNEQSFRVFYDIAAACSGLAFYIDSRSVNQVLHTIEETIKGNKTVITSKIVPSRTIVDIPFTIDDQTDYAIISVSGNSVKLEVRGPQSHQDKIMWHENGKVIKLSGTTPGQYTATVWGTTATSIVIVGRTDFRFTHGFSALEPKAMSDTTPQPIAETDVYLSISVTDSKHLVHIESAQILNEREKPIGKPLPLIQKSEYFYITKPFVAPSHRFKISVQGIVMTTGEHISRINKIPITPQDPPKRPDKMKPTAKIEEGNSIEVKYNSSVKLTCKVLGYPRPQITWFNNIGAPKKSSNSILQEPYEYISYMTLRNVVQRAEYSCYASNEQGNDSKKIIVSVKNPLVVRTTPAGITRFYYGSKGTLICDIESSLPMNILWYYANEITGVNAQITSSDKYQISSNGTQLKITKMDMDLVGKYTCKASLLHSTDFQKSYSTRVEAAGLIRPKITGLTTKKVIKGTTVVLECSITSGVPVPKITWEFKAKTSANYKHVSDAKVLHISRVSDLQEGQYKCLAENVVGKDEHVISLIIQELPQITSLPTSAYQGIEGDAQLRIPCIATGIPKPVIKWYLNGHAISANGKHSIEDDALIIRNPTVSDTHSYTCEATSEVGRQVAIFPIHILQVPKVTGVGAKKVTVGTPTKIECQITKGEPKPKITWQFMDQSGSKFIPIAGSDTVLRISSAKNKHAGLYKCIAQNNVGTADHVTTLIVQEPPKIPSSSKSVYEGKEGDALLRIPCVATGLPKPVITWKLDGHVISPNVKYSIEDGALIIKNPTVSDTHLYTCEATNEVGVITATFQTHILQLPLVSGEDSKKVKIGTPDSIECQVIKGEPKPKITWQFMEKSGSKYIPIAGSDTVLRISSAEKKHAGRYKCIAQNNVGTADHVTTLIVQEPPRIPSSSNSVYEGKEGDSLLRIPCVATGLPKPTITWKLDDHVISSNTKYTIEDGALIVNNPTVSDTHLYTCEAKNEVGVETATFQTHILQTPKVLGVPSMTVRIGTPANIECTVVKGEPKPKITWFFMDKSVSTFAPVAVLDNVLRISRVEKKDAGSYKCVAQNGVGGDEHVTALTVEFPPEITSNTSIVYEGLQEDLALRIPCDAVGIPKPVISWKLRGNAIIPNEKYAIEDGALVIKDPKKNDSTLYTCEATNSLGSTSANFKANIEEDLGSYGTEDHIYLLKGETRKLNCETFSSKSHSIRWFTNGIYNKTDDSYEVVNATVELDGNYTCRVSDNHGFTHTHTYVVDVGYPPKLYNSLELNEWRGDVTDILTKCDADAKPSVTVEWKFNNQVLSDQDAREIGISYKWGHYTCNVSNVHGSVETSFDVKSSACLINRNLKDAEYMPLLLTDDLTWPQWETTKYFSIVDPEEKIKFTCPNHKGAPNVFKKFPEQTELKAFCSKEDLFLVNGKLYKLSELQCSVSLEPSIIRKKEKCLTEKSESIRVGYNVGGFLETYEVCYDHAIDMPLYTRVLTTATDGTLNPAHNWYKYPGIGDSKVDKGFTCKDSLSSCCYSKSQLVNARDFNYSPAKNSTFIDPLNVVPVWHPCRNTRKTSWQDIEELVRMQLVIYSEFIVWTGTHTLQENHGEIIPRYLWKVLRFDEDEAMAIVYVNDASPTEKDIKCENICTEEHWLTPKDKYTYCCNLEDFLNAFDLSSTDVGESMDSALDKIGKSS